MTLTPAGRAEGKEAVLPEQVGGSTLPEGHHPPPTPPPASCQAPDDGHD